MHHSLVSLEKCIDGFTMGWTTSGRPKLKRQNVKALSCSKEHPTDWVKEPSEIIQLNGIPDESSVYQRSR